MVSEGHLVAIFHSVHRVLKAEKVLKHRHLTFRLIPAPRQIAADCGLALSFSQESLADIESALVAEDITIVELWRMGVGEYSRVK